MGHGECPSGLRIPTCILHDAHGRDGDPSGDRGANCPGRDLAAACGGSNLLGPDPEPDKAADEVLHAWYCHGKPQLPGRYKGPRILKQEAIHGSVGIEPEEMGLLNRELAAV